jgi:hypothetical protein
MTLTKNTVRLKAEFRNFAGVLADPQQITLDISYQLTSASIIHVVEADITKESTGIYHYDYPVPIGTGNLLYEWSGSLESSPIVNRGLITREWLRE